MPSSGLNVKTSPGQADRVDHVLVALDHGDGGVPLRTPPVEVAARTSLLGTAGELAVRLPG
jgi:hypothetical protein